MKHQRLSKYIQLHVNVHWADVLVDKSPVKSRLLAAPHYRCSQRVKAPGDSRRSNGLTWGLNAYKYSPYVSSDLLNAVGALARS
jgi:hypothetical protein